MYREKNVRTKNDSKTTSGVRHLVGLATRPLLHAPETLTERTERPACNNFAWFVICRAHCLAILSRGVNRSLTENGCSRAERSKAEPR
eukprot:679217-Prorocentrum_minimum.AAC.8